MKKLCIVLAALMLAAGITGCEDKDEKSKSPSETVYFSEVDIPDSDYVKPEGKDFETQENEDGTLSIMLYLGKDTALEIPSEIDGKKVTQIGNSAFKGSILTGIKLPDTITTIDSLAFHSCQSLVEVEMKEGLKKIGNAVFYNCLSLYKMDFPDSLEHIGDNCFYSTPWLHLQYNKDEDFIIVADGYLFSYYGDQAEVVVPDGVRIVGAYSFYYYQDIKSVKLPDSVEIIGEKAFNSCTTLHTMELGNSVKRIDKAALYNCEKLVKLNLPASIETLGDECIGFCRDSTGMSAVMENIEITCSGGAAESYLKENNIPYKTK